MPTSARAQGQWLQGLAHRFPVGVRPEGPDREQVHITNMFVYVPIVSTGWDGGNQAVSDWLGARNLTTEDLGAEPYVAVLLGGSASHLKFMGGFDTSVESPADMNEAADQGKWLMEYADRPDLGLESCHGAPGSRRCLADTFREETEREPRVVLLRMRDQEVGGRVVRSMIRLCIWVGRFPHTTTANHDWLEDDIDVVALDQLLSVQSVGAWRSFTLWQAFAGAVHNDPVWESGGLTTNVHRGTGWCGPRLWLHRRPGTGQWTRQQAGLICWAARRISCVRCYNRRVTEPACLWVRLAGTFIA